MRIRAAVCFGIALALSGRAADYLNNYDTMTLATGNANNTNQLLQTVDPFNPNSNNTHIEGDSARSVAVIQQYKSGGAGGGYKGNCATPGDTADNGSSCGGRAASVRSEGALGP